MSATRTLKVTLSADVTPFQAALAKASTAVDGLGKTLGQASQTQAWRDVSTALLGFGVTLASVGVLAVAKFASFDAAMSKVAATGADARANMESLTAAAIEMGGATAFSAEEAAGGIEELLKAGVSAQAVLGGGLKGALDLAAAGNLSVGESAELAATAMTQFGLSGADIPHVADLIAAGAGKAQGEISDMAGALKQSGLVAAQFGLSIEETSGALAMFAANGLIGSDAGTSLKAALLALATPSTQAKKQMDELGISAYDAAGNFVGMDGLAAQLKAQLSGLTPAARDAALGIIFGADAIRVANILYKEGAEGVRDWVDQVNDAGYAAIAAAEKQNNLRGDLEKLGGAVDSLLISVGSAGDGAARGGIQALTGLIDGLAENTGAAQALVAISTGLGLVALSIGGLMKATTAISELRTAVINLGASTDTAGSKMRALGLAGGAVGVAITVATVALGAHLAKQAELKSQTEQLAQVISSSGDDWQAAADKMVAYNLEQAGALEAAKSLGISLKDLGDAATGNGDAFDRVQESLGRYRLQAQMEAADGQPALAQAIRTVEGALKQQQTAVEGAHDSIANQAEVTGEAAGANEELADSIDLSAAAAEAAAAAMADLEDKIRGQYDAAIAASNATIAHAQSLEQVAEAAKAEGIVIDETTGKIDVFANKASRDAQSALNDLAVAQRRSLDAMKEQGAGIEQQQAASESMRAEWIAAATQMTGNAAAAAAMATSYGLVPKSVVTDITVPGAIESITTTEDLYAALQQLPPDKQVKVKTALDRGGIDAAKAELASIRDKSVTIRTYHESYGSASAAAVPGSGPQVYAAMGGYITGPGTATSDSVPAWLSNGEYVLRAAAVASLGLDRLHYANQTGQWPRYASGGPVATSMRVAPPTYQPQQAPAPQSVDAHAIGSSVAAALDGRHLTLMVDGQPIRAIVRAVNSAVAGQRQWAAI